VHAPDPADGFPAARRIAPSLVVLDSVGSTNTELVARAAGGGLEHLATLATLHQTSGKGRLGRTWVAPRGAALAASVLLRPIDGDGTPVPPRHLGWIPLAAGVAMTDAVAAELPGRRDVALKWPNDVLVGDRKVCGVLAELLPGGDGLVIGAGVNLAMREDELPVPTATSLSIAGADVGADAAAADGGASALADRVLAAYLARLGELVAAYVAAGPDAEASGLRAAAIARCGTLGRRVRVVLPGDDELLGTATGLDATGRLLVQRDDDGGVVPIAAGDVTHVRHR
jgi:BirA family transcriptional regulator, biotin operon repressor / biotin---[acetyl-CoA-carboxylase] ligase